MMESTDISPAGQWFKIHDDKTTIVISNLLKFTIKVLQEYTMVKWKLLKITPDIAVLLLSWPSSDTL